MTTVQTTIEDGLIDHVTLYQPRVWFLRWDVFPFLIVYVASSIFITQDGPLKLAALVIFPIGLALHLLLFLLAQSSVAFRCFIGKRKVYDIQSTVDIHVHAAKNAGKDRLVNLLHMRGEANHPGVINVLGENFPLTTQIFIFQEVVYCFDQEKKSFSRLNYPVVFKDNNFMKWKGHESEEAMVRAFRRWGINEFNIPLPHFLDLYMEHLVAPFFVFQVLCLFLWSLDDYWYYSAFTLMMLMIFEGVMCNQRQNSVLMMRNMRRPPYKIFVYRMNKWMFLNTDGIFPGDIVSITADQTIYPSDITESGMIRQRKPDANYEGKVLPCDILLVRGSCVVNEAMLTGESIPKVKESITPDDTENLLNTDITKNSAWSRHFLLGGTLIQQHSSYYDYSNLKNTANIPQAPDNGCLGIVIRTGFATTQGELMRKILFATESTTGNSKETFGFIAVLVMFAIVAAGFVLNEGIFDEKRNKFRLVLHCIMIITSVVPPELPMELSLAVTNSLGALARQMIFCTEPYRIPFAGKLNVVCFDKTGTLTKDEMILKGIVAGQNVDIFSGKLKKETNRSSEEGDEDNDDENEAEEVDHGAMISPDTTTDFVQLINGTCHDLVERRGVFTPNSPGMKGEILGDPLEIASFSTSGFEFISSPSQNNNNNNNNNGGGASFAATDLINSSLNIQVKILHKFPFNSELKRMSTVVAVRPLNPSSAVSGDINLSQSPSIYIFTKGAPEIIQQHLKEIPENYNEYSQHHMQSGKRVLAIAYKKLSDSFLKSQSNLSLNRSQAESDLIFAGFLIFDCDLKMDSRSVIRDLIQSNHKVVMITGDSVYTAANVGKRVALYDAKKIPLILTTIRELTSKNSNNYKKGLVWRRMDILNEGHAEFPDRHVSDIDFDYQSLSSLVNTNNILCITGASIEFLIELEQSSRSKQSTTNTAAAHMEQSSSTKELISSDFLPIMKRICSFITIFARVSPLQKEKIILAFNEIGSFTLMCGDGTNDVGALKSAYVGVSIINNPKLENKVEENVKANSSSKKNGKIGSSNKDRLERALMELQEHEADPTIIKLGDASIASPFTAKRTSVDSVLTVIRQGRCTLVGSIQVYKVLALNCLSSAFMMSTLYMKGLKQGDTQMTCSGLIIAGLFFFVSQAKPLSNISPNRPPSSVFQLSVSFSIFGQFLIHLLSMYITLLLCSSSIHNENITLIPDSKFIPNLFNSAMFLLSNHMQINNFWINYRGPPYMEEISLNYYLYKALQVIYVILLIIIGGQFEPINDFLQLVPFPNQDFQIKFLGILAGNSFCNFLIEQISRRME